jgi:hypothetical protein
MLKTYGRRVVAELDGLRMSLVKVTDGELGEMRGRYMVID